MKDFINIDNVPFNWIDRLNELEEYSLFVNDCFWVLKTSEFYEFYYNPRNFMGKIASSEMPDIVLHRINNCSVVLKKGDTCYGQIAQGTLQTSSVKFRHIEKDMRIGNWFYAQGQNYATWKGKFICDDMYVEGLERECSIHNIGEHIVYDMMRMSCKSRTPHYIRTIFDLSIFRDVDVSRINIFPFNDEEWNPKKWIDEFKAHSDYVTMYKDSYDVSMIRSLRSEVFKHTVNAVKLGGYCMGGIKYTLSEDDSRNMIEGTCFYDKPFDVSSLSANGSDTIINVENADCLIVARKLQNRGYNVAVLNMASRQNPGGGVLGGAGAQEENIFRRTNLFQSLFQFANYANQYGLKLSNKQYPLDKDFGGIYTPNAVVFRGEEEKGYPLLGADAFSVSFISVAGINHPELKDTTHLADSMIEGTKNKMRTILRIGLRHGHDSLVLGALGCGAFCNPPSHIAKLFHEVFEEPEFKNKYRLISFAILDDHNAHKSHNPEGNYKPFVEEFFSISRE